MDNKKYLIIRCSELNDQFECDADREPLCIVDNYTKYSGYGYEIYEILSDGNLNMIKEYSVSWRKKKKKNKK